MNNYINPITLIKEEFIEATTLKQKSLVIFLTLWATTLTAIVIAGVGTISYELISNPSTFDNATWGVFDTLG